MCGGSTRVVSVSEFRSSSEQGISRTQSCAELTEGRNSMERGRKSQRQKELIGFSLTFAPRAGATRQRVGLTSSD